MNLDQTWIRMIPTVIGRLTGVMQRDQKACSQALSIHFVHAPPSIVAVAVAVAATVAAIAAGRSSPVARVHTVFSKFELFKTESLNQRTLKFCFLLVDELDH